MSSCPMQIPDPAMSDMDDFSDEFVDKRVAMIPLENTW